MRSASTDRADSRATSPRDRPFAWALAHATLGVTLALMVVGAATRAARAGVACPDWPLCHGHWIPPTHSAAYPANPAYQVYRVYLEFSHRVLAAFVASGGAMLGIRAWRGRGGGPGGGPTGRRDGPSSDRALAVGLWIVIACQVLMGAVTVWLRNAPFTVVIHLGLAMSFVALVMTARERFRPTGSAPPAAVGAGFQCATRAVLGLVVAQMLLGAIVSSKLIGLACFDFPTCNGGIVPPVWTVPIAWQIAHRALGATVALTAFAVFGAAHLGGGAATERRVSALVLGLVSAQILLGGVTVWLRIPPAVSAAHLGVATVLLATLIHTMLRPSSRRSLDSKVK